MAGACMVVCGVSEPDGVALLYNEWSRGREREVERIWEGDKQRLKEC